MKTICLDQFKIYSNNSKILRFFNVRIKDIAFYVERGYLYSNNNNLKKDDKIKILVMLHLCCEKDNRIGIELK